MTDVLLYWGFALALIACIAIVLIVRYPARRWPRPLAVSAAGAILSMTVSGDAGATRAILMAGLVLTVCTAAAERK
jgi:uncharacterized membrane protein YjjB (DUF3815 family)